MKKFALPLTCSLVKPSEDFQLSLIATARNPFSTTTFATRFLIAFRASPDSPEVSNPYTANIHLNGVFMVHTNEVIDG